MKYLVAQKCQRGHADVLRAAPHPVLAELLQRLGRLASGLGPAVCAAARVARAPGGGAALSRVRVLRL